jgi:uncharacterized protein YbaR (Trm112 family)
MVDKELLDILCCPETKQDLALLDQKTVDKINSAIAQGKVKNKAGEDVKERIREDIPIMLPDEAIAFEAFEA